MRHTNRQSTTATLTDLFRALEKRQPVTATYMKEEKDEAGRRTGRQVETVRTLEIFDLRTTADGHIVIKAMDRQTREERTFRLDRVTAYTVHRSATYVVERTDDTPTPALPRTPAALAAYEIARDEITAARRRLALAA